MRALLTALLILIASTGAEAQNEADPAAFVRGIYRHYQGAHSKGWSDPGYSARLVKLVEEDRKNTPQGDIGKLDFDPFINGQDWKITGVTVTLVSGSTDNAVVDAQFRNMGNAEYLRYTLTRENGRWLVAELQRVKKPRWILSKILTGAPDAFPDETAK